MNRELKTGSSSPWRSIFLLDVVRIAPSQEISQLLQNILGCLVLSHFLHLGGAVCEEYRKVGNNLISFSLCIATENNIHKTFYNLQKHTYGYWQCKKKKCFPVSRPCRIPSFCSLLELYCHHLPEIHAPPLLEAVRGQRNLSGLQNSIKYHAYLRYCLNNYTPLPGWLGQAGPLGIQGGFPNATHTPFPTTGLCLLNICFSKAGATPDWIVVQCSGLWLERKISRTSQRGKYFLSRHGAVWILSNNIFSPPPLTSQLLDIQWSPRG